MKLSNDELTGLIDEGGALSNVLPRFEVREEQKKLLNDITDAFNDERIALLEAGTGVGKSFAYLLPALILSQRHQERVVISTHTIHLQEQLVHKDLPLLMRALGSQVKVTLAMGRRNYYCRLRGEENASDALSAWSMGATNGRRSSVPFPILESDWDEVAVDPDSCLHKRCPYYQECFFFNDRRQAEKSQIIVANHHLLLSDLVAKKRGDPSPLPDYKFVIVDEAHHLERASTQLFARELSQKRIFKLLSRLLTEGTTAKRGRLNQIFDLYNDEVSRKMDLLATKREFADTLARLFVAVNSLLGQESRLRIKEPLRRAVAFQEVPAKEVLEVGEKLLRMIKVALAKLKPVDEMSPKEESLRFETNAMVQRIGETLSLVSALFLQENDPKRVGWFEKDPKDLRLVEAPLEVGALLKEHLFDQMRSTVLLSATLATHSGFGYTKERLGVDGEPIEALYSSPFDYKNQALFLIPEDLPKPDDQRFMEEANSVILDAITASRGRAFILFTSYGALIRSYEALKAKLKGYTLLKQGDSSRRDLIDQFKKAKKPILFGTDSFWEGVDIAGEALSLVIIHKLPFPMPSEPLIEAQGELLEQEGKSAFFSYHLPKAVVKFKQGFGRLIRHQKDRGVVICLDQRIISKGYGKAFAKSLPPCEIRVTKNGEHRKHLKDFYRV